MSAPIAKALLQQNFLFRDLPEPIINRIAELARRRKNARDEVIFHQGDIGDSLFGVIAGQVRISVSDENGKEVFLNIMEANDAFGEIALIDGEPRTATATAMTEVDLISIDRDRFLALMQDEPSLAIHLLHIFCERLRWTSGLVEDAVFLGMSARLAKRLLHLCERHGHAAGDGVAIDISQSELAQFLSVSRQKVNKCLREWSKEGIIDLSRGKILVLHKEKLRGFVGGG